jgi:hypothetical protein
MIVAYSRVPAPSFNRSSDQSFTGNPIRTSWVEKICDLFWQLLEPVIVGCSKVCDHMGKILKDDFINPLRGHVFSFARDGKNNYSEFFKETKKKNKFSTSQCPSEEQKQKVEHLKALAELEAKNFTNILQETLQSLDLSHLQDIGFTDDEIEILKRHSAGIYRLDHFFRDVQLVEKPTLLGTSFNDMLFQISNVFKGRDYLFAYLELMNNTIANTENFMGKLMDEGKPVLMLIPNDLSKTAITSEEIQWLLKHPEKMKNVYFIYGVYAAHDDPRYGLMSKQDWNTKDLDNFRSQVFQKGLIELRRLCQS